MSESRMEVSRRHPKSSPGTEGAGRFSNQTASAVNSRVKKVALLCVGRNT